jgi:ribosomal protein S18 acetylase RimI-like enzyme
VPNSKRVDSSPETNSGVTPLSEQEALAFVFGVHLMKPEISIAQLSDAAEILSLQKRAFQSEALRYNNFEIAPLKQTIDEVRNDFSDHVFLKATYDIKIVGSVKLKKTENKCYVGRLIVEPELQKKGIGTQLLRAAEKIVPDVVEYFLYTGSESHDNIGFYRKLGYNLDGNYIEEKGLKLVGLSKPSSTAGRA